MPDLSVILARVRRQVAAEATVLAQRALKRRLKAKWKERNRSAEQISADYARRLQDKATFRRLLADPRQDADRFRWLFEHSVESEKMTDIDQFRAWVDSRRFRKVG